MNTRLIWITPDAEKLMGYCARVSNPANQDNPDVSKLLAYCARNKHWSVFEMANMCVEINTTRAISAQILRHRSFHFQEWSQRYAETNDIDIPTVRRQDNKNRQNSIDDLSQETLDWWTTRFEKLSNEAREFYQEALEKGIAKECARFVLPMSTKTKLYMNGTIRSWIHYLDLRCAHGTQKEHQDLANEIKSIFVRELPIVSNALGWTQ